MDSALVSDSKWIFQDLENQSDDIHTAGNNICIYTNDLLNTVPGIFDHCCEVDCHHCWLETILSCLF